MELSRLLVVIEPDQEQQPALQRALWLASRQRVALHLLLVDYHGALANNPFFDGERQQRVRKDLLEQRRQWIEALVADARESGIEISVEVRWGKAQQRIVLQCVNDQRPDLLLKSEQDHGLFGRAWLSNASWQLIRHSPVPTWMCRNNEWRGQRLCAALDPLHDFAESAQLEHTLIDTALGLGDALQMRPLFIHCHAPLPRSLVFDEELLLDYQHYVERSNTRHRQAFADVLAPYPIDADQAHLLEGAAEEAIPRFVREEQIDLLLMGAVARGHLEDALIGHTAERMLDAVHCDLLVLKPSQHT